MSCKHNACIFTLTLLAGYLFYYTRLNNTTTFLENTDIKPAPPSQATIQANILLTLQYLSLSPPSDTHWDRVSTVTSKMTYYARTPDVIYTGVPKAGCTNWKYTILREEPEYRDKVDKPGPKVHDVMNSLGLEFSSWNWRPGGRVAINTKFSFTVVRNPWTRIVSGYMDKIKSSKRVIWQGGKVSLEILNEYRRKEGERMYIKDDLIDGVKPTFLEFLQYLSDVDIEEMNDHFRPQYTILGIEHVRYSYVGALEHAQIQSQHILNHFKSSVSESGTIPGPYDSSADPRLEHSTLLAKEWFSTVPQGLVDTLYNKFWPDFRIYNYSNFTHHLFPFPLSQ